MDQKQIDAFFTTLSKNLEHPLKIILTGASAGNLMGQVRPSLDIDFCIRHHSKSPRLWDAIDQAVKKTMEETQIPAQYSEDIDRWGMITLLDYEKHARFYKKFGRLKVLLMDPIYWSIGKITRYLDSDREDVWKVFKKEKVSLQRTLRIWALALKKSPRSAALQHFVDHATHFFRTHGTSIWGKTFDEEKAINFYRQN